jgi:hypothetical protein
MCRAPPPESSALCCERDSKTSCRNAEQCASAGQPVTPGWTTDSRREAGLQTGVPQSNGKRSNTTAVSDSEHKTHE